MKEGKKEPKKKETKKRNQKKETKKKKTKKRKPKKSKEKNTFFGSFSFFFSFVFLRAWEKSKPKAIKKVTREKKERKPEECWCLGA